MIGAPDYPPSLSTVNSYPAHRPMSSSLSSSSPGSLLARSGNSTISNYLPEAFVPGHWDVICQRGKDCQDHVGNRRFRICVQSFVNDYVTSKTRQEKSSVISSIIKAIKETANKLERGDFVMKDLKTHRWYYVDTKVARDKVGNVLRDAVKQKQDDPSTSGIETPLLLLSYSDNGIGGKDLMDHPAFQLRNGPMMMMGSKPGVGRERSDMGHSDRGLQSLGGEMHRPHSNTTVPMVNTVDFRSRQYQHSEHQQQSHMPPSQQYAFLQGGTSPSETNYHMHNLKTSMMSSSFIKAFLSPEHGVYQQQFNCQYQNQASRIAEDCILVDMPSQIAEDDCLSVDMQQSQPPMTDASVCPTSSEQHSLANNMNSTRMCFEALAESMETDDCVGDFEPRPIEMLRR